MKALALLVLLVGSAIGFQLPLDVEPDLPLSVDLDLDAKEYWELILDWLKTRLSQSGPGKVLMTKTRQTTTRGRTAVGTRNYMTVRQPDTSMSAISAMANLLSMRGVTMQVTEGLPKEDGGATRLPRSSIVDGRKVVNNDVTSQIADMIARQLLDAGVTAEDLADFIANQTRRTQDVGDEQFPHDDGGAATGGSADAEVSESGEVDDADGVTDGSEPAANGGKAPASLASPRYPKLLRAPAPPPSPGGSAPDVFGNGTDYFEWLEEILKEVKDRMDRSGSTADGTALDERPKQMDGKSTDDDVDRPSDPVGEQGFEAWQESEDEHGGFDSIPKAVPMIVMSGNTYIKDIGNFRNIYSYGSLPVKVKTIEPNGNDSGLELDKSETDDSNASENSGKPLQALRLESSKRDGNSRRRDYIKSRRRNGRNGGTDRPESRKRDGNARQRDHLLSSSARNSKVHGHDDGDTTTYHSAVHGHDDGDNSGGPIHDDGDDKDDGPVHGHDDGDSGSSHPVHGHDDGDNSNGPVHDDGDTKDDGPVHGHDDGDSGSSHPVHGHDDGDNSNGPVHDDGDSKDDGPVHGHDDGDSGSNHPVHGHDDGDNSNGPVHDDGDTKDDGPVHGHDDGDSGSNGPVYDDGDDKGDGPVHGHDDGGDPRERPVHGHDDGDDGSDGPVYDDRDPMDDGPVHGHDDGGRPMERAVHGHDDGNSRNRGPAHDAGDAKFDGPVHGHDDGNSRNRGPAHDAGDAKFDGPVHGHDDGNSRNRGPVHDAGDAKFDGPVHGHDDGNSRNRGPVHDAGDAKFDGPVHGHDDGNSRNRGPVHDAGDAKFDGPVHGHDDGNSRNRGPVHDAGDAKFDGPVHGHDDGGSHSRSLLRASEGKRITMTMVNVSLAVLGSAAAVLVVLVLVHGAKKKRLGFFKRADYIMV